MACQQSKPTGGIIRGGNDTIPVNLTCTPGTNCAPVACGNQVCDAGESCFNCPQDCNDVNGQSCQRIGTIYSVWHQPTSYAASLAAQQNSVLLTLEDVLRSRQEVHNGNTLGYGLGAVLSNPSVAQASGNYYYQYKPQDGYYCIYHHRDSNALNYHAETDDASPYDCPGYRAELLRHAELLVTAGIDHVLVDMTHAAFYSTPWDIAQLRPFEVLVEEWTRLRANGVQTPDIAAWQSLPSSGNAGESMASLVMKIYNQASYSEIFLRDAATHKKILFYPTPSAADMNAVDAIELNGGSDDMLAVPLWVGQQANAAWSIFAPCHTPVMLDDTPCGQIPTFNSKVGSQLSVAATYQSTYASEPFQAPGVYGGMTLRKQFVQAFALQPDYLLVSSWNEQIAQPATGPGPSMGLENDATAGDQAFVGLYGVEFSRDIEPNVEYGAMLYDIVQSCIRLFRSGATSCSDPTTLCCQGGNFSDTYTFYNGAQGAFGLYVTDPNNERTKINLCVSGTTDFFLSANSACEMQTIVKTLGFISQTKGGETLRPLRRCFTNTGHSYDMTGACPTGTSEEQVLGYVR